MVQGVIEPGVQLEALADATRRSIFELVRRRPSSVRELTDQVTVSQPAVSQHLKVLVAAGLVEVTPQGTRNIYTASPYGLAPLRQWVETMWDDVLDEFTRTAAKEAE